MSIYDKVRYFEVDNLKFKDLLEGDFFVSDEMSGIYECLGEGILPGSIRYKELFDIQEYVVDGDNLHKDVKTVSVSISQEKRKRFFGEFEIGDTFHIPLGDKESAVGIRDSTYGSGFFNSHRVMKIGKTKLPDRPSGWGCEGRSDNGIEYINCIRFSFDYGPDLEKRIHSLDGYYLKDDDEVFLGD
jgi:hypothetical protein